MKPRFKYKNLNTNKSCKSQNKKYNKLILELQIKFYNVLIKQSTKHFQISETWLEFKMKILNILKVKILKSEKTKKFEFAHKI